MSLAFIGGGVAWMTRKDGMVLGEKMYYFAGGEKAENKMFSLRNSRNYVPLLVTK